MRVASHVRTWGISLFALALIVGCSSGGGRMEEGSKAIEGFQTTKKELGKAQTQIDKTLASMNALNAGGDLKKSYATYNSEVADLQKSAANARKRAADMREKMNAYVTKWQGEMEEMNDPTIRAGLEERRKAVRANFENVRNAAHGARDAYQPFMAQLQEIQKALSIDLSPNTLPGLKPAMDKANAQGATLKAKLGEMQAELDKIYAGMSATGAPPAKK